MTPTRGERNNNPGNLDRTGTQWEGMAAAQPDPRFICFADPVMGIRALAKVLLTYQRKHQLDTIRGIVSRWAPPAENNTEAYVSHVAEEVGAGPDDEIDLEDLGVLFALTKAIIEHENGRCVYSNEVLLQAVTKALS